MSVAYGVSIVVPYVCAVYTCRCGRRAVRHGKHCGSPPPGWHERPAGSHVCERCTQQQKPAR